MNLNVTLPDDNTEKNKTINENLNSNVMALNFFYSVPSVNWFLTINKCLVDKACKICWQRCTVRAINMWENLIVQIYSKGHLEYKCILRKIMQKFYHSLLHMG